MASLLIAFAATGCNAPVGSGEAQLVTAGSAPGTLATPRAAVGGVVELARVRFAGSDLGTDLVDDPVSRVADGWTLVTGAAGLAYPMTASASDASSALPVGPGLQGEEPLHCVTRLGAPRAPTALSGISVDVGDALRFHDSDELLQLRLQRHPISPAETPFGPVYYRTLEPARTPGAPVATGNWRAGAALTMEIPGADPPAVRERGSIPIRSAVSDGLNLPTSLEGLALNGTSISLPARDPGTGAVIDTLTPVALPTADQPLTLTWNTNSRAEDITVSLEYYGAGLGRCPAGCGESAECCLVDTDCSSQESCLDRTDGAGKACFPKLGSGDARLGALVCSVRDTGSITLTADLLATLNQDVPASSVRGVVLRVGRTTSALVSVPDVMTADRTRQSISPVVVRASDVVITRLATP